MLVFGLEITQAHGIFGGLQFPRWFRLASMVSVLLDRMQVVLSLLGTRSSAALNCWSGGMLARACCHGSEITTSKRTENGFRYKNPWASKSLRHHQANRIFKLQEPYAYTKHAAGGSVPPDQIPLYQAVERICKFYVELRYSLMQLLYDAMFENIIDGLPIARSMVYSPL